VRFPLCAVAKAAKAVAGKVKLQAGLDEDAAEDEDDDNEARRLWGANKKSYHGADDEVLLLGWTMAFDCNSMMKRPQR
jgi:hypothetical protein